MATNQTINVNYTPGLFQPTLYYSQDDVGRVFQINLEGFEIPSGATVTIQATKPSGLGFTVAADSVSDNVATFTTTSVMTDENGRFPAELHIVSGNVEVGTANFLMVGERNPHPSGTTDGSQGTIIPELTLLVERVEAAADSIHNLSVTATTLPAGSDATASFDDETDTLSLGIPRGADGDVTREEFNDLKSDLRLGYRVKNVTTNGSFTASGLTTGGTNRIRTDLISFSVGDKITIDSGSLQHACGMWQGSVSAANIQRNDNAFLANPETITATYNGYLVVVFRNSSNADLSPTDFDGSVKAYLSNQAKIAESLDDLDNLQSDFDSCFDSEVHSPTNLLDRSAVTFGKYCTNTGAIADNASYWYTDFIPVEEGETYTRQRGSLTVLEGREIVSTRWISCYDSNKNMLADKGASDSPTSFTVPSGVAYLRFSGSNYMDAISNPAIVKGTEVLDYSEYFEPYNTYILKEECLEDSSIPRRFTNGIAFDFNVNSDNHIYNNNNQSVEDMFGYSIVFNGRLSALTDIVIGHGYNEYMAGWVHITPTQFSYYLGTESNPRLSEAHNLTLKDYIAVRIDAKPNIKADFTIYTNGGVYKKTDQVWDVRRGALQVRSSAGTNTLSDCTLCYISRGWGEKIHLYGDSYFGVYNDKWTQYLVNNGWTKNNLNAYPGRASAEALTVLKNVLRNSNPEKIIWCMGMNDGDDDGAVDAVWKASVDELMDICDKRNIELILATIPNVPTVDNTYKNAYVRASGYRYIDFASAVGASSGTTWYDGMLSSDGVHPNIQGAIALFNQAIADVPELMQ